MTSLKKVFRKPHLRTGMQLGKCGEISLLPALVRQEIRGKNNNFGYQLNVWVKVPMKRKLRLSYQTEWLGMVISPRIVNTTYTKGSHTLHQIHKNSLPHQWTATSLYHLVHHSDSPRDHTETSRIIWKWTNQSVLPVGTFWMFVQSCRGWRYFGKSCAGLPNGWDSRL